MKPFGNGIYVEGASTFEDQITSTLPDGGLSPFSVISKVLNNNLNADLLDGFHGVYYLARVNHTGTQLAATISDFSAATRLVTLLGLTVVTGSPITASDTILSALGKIQGQINTSIAAVTGTIGNLPKFGTTTSLAQSIVNEAAGVITVSGKLITNPGSNKITQIGWDNSAHTASFPSANSIGGTIGFTRGSDGVYVNSIFVYAPTAAPGNAMMGYYSRWGHSFGSNSGEHIRINEIGQFQSLIATGSIPFLMTSTTMSPNLNSDLLDGYHAADFPRKVENATITGAWTFSSAPIITTPGTNANSAATYGQITALSTTVNARLLTISGTAGRISSSAGPQSLAADRTWTLDLVAVGTAGTYQAVTTDAYGRVTAGSNPTTMSGYGITDVVYNQSYSADWDTLNADTKAKFNTSAANGPLGTTTAHGLFIPHLTNTGYGSEIAFRDGAGFFRSDIGGTWTSWLQFADRAWVIAGYTPLTRNIIAGGGLTGGGTLAADRTISMGAPSNLDSYTTNNVSGTTHTHAIFTGDLIAGTNVTLTGVATNRLVSVGNVTVSVNSFPHSSLTGVPTLFNLTPGTGLSGSNFNTSSAQTWSINFGTSAGTVAQGNDSRINNGQTAYTWGNHASAGYVPASRTLTINGVPYDLSANRSWTISGPAPTVIVDGAATNQYVMYSSYSGTPHITFGQIGDRGDYVTMDVPMQLVNVIHSEMLGLTPHNGLLVYQMDSGGAGAGVYVCILGTWLKLGFA